MTRQRLVDAAIAAGLMVVSALVALQFLRAEARRPYFFDWELVPATAMACGQGFSQPLKPIVELTDFVARRSAAFDCSRLPAEPPLIGASALANANRYGLFGPALAMSIGGVSWVTLDRYVATMFGLAMALSYALLRLVSMRWLAVLGTLQLAVSNKLLALVGHRDYIKEPPFLALLVVITWLVISERSRRGVWLAAAAGGLLLGIGIGCRADVLIVGPFFVAALLIFVRWSPGAGGLRNRAVALMLFAASFAVTGTPILRTISGGSNLSHTLLLGFMTPFTTHLGLTLPAYDVGAIYSDGYAYNLIAAQARIREHDLGPVPFGEPEYDQAGARLLGDIARQFPADMLARGYGAVIEALDYPVSPDARYDSRGLAGVTASPMLWRIANWRYEALAPLTDRGALLTLLALVVAASVNLRLALFASSAVLYFCAYSMLQFSRRHTFHLDIFMVAAAMFLLSALVGGVRQAMRRDTRATMHPRVWAINVLTYTGLATFVVVAPLVLLRWYQGDHVRAMVETTLADSRIPVPISTKALADGTLIAGAALGERRGPGPIDDVRDVRMDYVVSEFSGAACGTEPFEVRTQYTGVVQTLDKEFNRVHTVVPSAAGAFQLMTPVFYEYGPYWLHFDGLVLPTSRSGCLVSMRRAGQPGELPFPFLYAALDPLWRESRLYQRFPWE